MQLKPLIEDLWLCENQRSLIKVASELEAEEDLRILFSTPADDRDDYAFITRKEAILLIEHLKLVFNL